MDFDFSQLSGALSDIEMHDLNNNTHDDTSSETPPSSVVSIASSEMSSGPSEFECQPSALPNSPVLSRKRKANHLELQEIQQKHEKETKRKRIGTDFIVSKSTGRNVYISALKQSFDNCKTLEIKVSITIDEDVEKLETNLYLTAIPGCEKMSIEVHTINKIGKNVDIFVNFMMETPYESFVIEAICLYSSEKRCFFQFLDRKMEFVNEVNYYQFKDVLIKEFRANNFVPYPSSYDCMPWISKATFSINSNNFMWFKEESFAFFVEETCDFVEFEHKLVKDTEVSVFVGRLLGMKFVLGNGCKMNVINRKETGFAKLVMIDSDGTQKIQEILIKMDLGYIEHLLVQDPQVEVRLCDGEGTLVDELEVHFNKREHENFDTHNFYFMVHDNLMVIPNSITFLVDERIVKTLEVTDFEHLLDDHLEVKNLFSDSVFYVERDEPHHFTLNFEKFRTQ
jgi:hypothetical protein